MGESNDMATGYIMGRDSQNGYGSFGGFGNGDWIWVLLILALFGGWGNNGAFGGNGGVMGGYTLASDFATLQRQMSDGFATTERRTDAIINGICDLGYTSQSLANGINMNVMQNGYESRLATQTLGSQIANCCCDLKGQISDVNYNLATQANMLSRGIERGFADTNYNMATQNCATLTAIDKVGDRVINYLAAEKAQSLRDENQALRLAASQQAQNNYLINQLRPCPIPAYITCNPFCCNNNGTAVGCSSI